ncbi:hypothetical protein GCM10009804_35340 [Kribbella hippodromi]|uniref:Uncharacterized protein n=1 Tax=Kribbella hippodromi TaxID=434347 RepID=A0ABP4P808_9ACTN
MHDWVHALTRVSPQMSVPNTEMLISARYCAETNTQEILSAQWVRSGDQVVEGVEEGWGGRDRHLR